ncbi:flagellin [Alkalicoccus luteus]|uniref:Flagellin n=1 Tax=Alkalicoccus luteus TaxID=1237094 RepID=A0A969PPJ4_9BACI|nr:flagellin [Alkalicoccus luteus]NJP37063.1 flagellin [Alkalicoccus luteus]
MIINNNISALNTHRQLGMNQNAMQNSMEKLASGLRINRAGDDAAGLAISEKMRAQINGLDQASRNAQDGISLIQTAEGALDETHSILQRMRELAVQSANDTNVEKDREEIQKEVDQLAQEISRISGNTEFNTQNLLGGDFQAKFQIGANANQNISLGINDMSATALGVIGTEPGAVVAVDGFDVQNLTENEITINYTTADTEANGAARETTAVFDAEANTITVTLGQAAGDGTDAGAITATKNDVISALNATGAVSAVEGGATGTDPATVVATPATVAAGTEDASKGINVSTQEAANAAITTINNAIETVSAERSKLGATQNRLDHTISNLNNASENLSAAESRIRDVDMAQEMMEMTRANILSQASQSMLAQANQQPQAVLQLLG